MTRTAQRLLRLITGSAPPPFALVHRPGTTGPGILDVLTGTVSHPARIADLPVPVPDTDAPGRHHVLALLPRLPQGEGPAPGGPARPGGLTGPGGLTALTVTEQALAPVAEVLGLLPGTPVALTEPDAGPVGAPGVPGVPGVPGTGRPFAATVADWSPTAALALFRRLLGRHPGSYWTFVVHTGDHAFIGASPRRHVALDRGTVVLNPVGGTHRYPSDGPAPEGLLAFLADPEEAAGLYRAVDEGLGTAGRLCEDGGRITGPRLRSTHRLAHTEYLVEGRTTRDVREILHETLPAPTAPDDGAALDDGTSPAAGAAPDGHPGVIALIGRDGRGRQALDSAVLDGTADIDAAGRLRFHPAPARVHGSDPAATAGAATRTTAETAGLLRALAADAPVPGERAPEPPDLGSHPAVRRALAGRNEPLAAFWQSAPGERARPVPALEGRRILVLDSGDALTAPDRTLLTALGATVEVRRLDEPHTTGPNGTGPCLTGPHLAGPYLAGQYPAGPDPFGVDAYGLDGYDLVVTGPGPGDPRRSTGPGIARLRTATARLLSNGTPFLAVGLGHQVLCTLLGLAVVRRPVPQRGVQRVVDLFGRSEPVGFHSAFVARCGSEDFPSLWRPGSVRVSRDPADDEVHALRGPDFASVQFHPASVLTRNGPAVLGGLLADLLAEPAERAERAEPAGTA
ncbi:anthranilate synthase family protein [Kitasatospora sp. NBC_00458]|uniref:anthranilate synthase family protein n=1 Tax=Kitasatospora sp. NBC_00458 TaxID=2903568 RepID=UPI002E16DDB0